jgi:predicted HicB family RNase H-like nuclease
MPVSEAKRRNNDKYNAKCDYINLRPLKAKGAAIRAAADAAGQSLQGYILQAIDERMARDDEARSERDKKTGEGI